MDLYNYGSQQAREHLSTVRYLLLAQLSSASPFFSTFIKELQQIVVYIQRR